MYEIYFNDKQLCLISSTLLNQFADGDDSTLVVRYSGNPKHLLHYIDLLEKPGRINKVVLGADDIDKLFDLVKAKFTIVEAAGGVVMNKDGNALVIFRRGKWDLPKGKVDPGETWPEAALREVMEETGLTGPSLDDFITTTYHSYKDGAGKRILKPTYWYKMRSKIEKLTPQSEEGIEQAEWLGIPSFLSSGRSTYPSIMAVLRKING